MKKNIIFILFATLFLFGCNMSNQRLKTKMLEKYTEDQNYITLSGEIIEFNDNTVLIKCEELANYISYEDEICEYYIYSDNLLMLDENAKVDFTTVPFHFYNGQKLPIVELKVNNNLLLSFEDGKKNLIKSVNDNF